MGGRSDTPGAVLGDGSQTRQRLRCARRAVAGLPSGSASSRLARRRCHAAAWAPAAPMLAGACAGEHTPSACVRACSALACGPDRLRLRAVPRGLVRGLPGGGRRAGGARFLLRASAHMLRASHKVAALLRRRFSAPTTPLAGVLPARAAPSGLAALRPGGGTLWRRPCGQPPPRQRRRTACQAIPAAFASGWCVGRVGGVIALLSACNAVPGPVRATGPLVAPVVLGSACARPSRPAAGCSVIGRPGARGCGRLSWAWVALPAALEEGHPCLPRHPTPNTSSA